MSIPTLLYVDNDPDDAALIRSALNDIGFQMNVVEVMNGRLALEYLRTHEVKPDLILLDINMPILDGLATLEALKSNKETFNIPVLVYTTSAKPEDEAFCARYGVDMITKPRNIRELDDIVQWLIESYFVG